jgi:hypothetical protein
MPAAAINPYTVQIPNDDLDDLKSRLGSPAGPTSCTAAASR